jgi:hypothetical protein
LQVPQDVLFVSISFLIGQVAFLHNI